MSSAAFKRRLARVREAILDDQDDAGERDFSGPAVQWAPFPDKDGRPSPQRLAYECEADELFWGGSAGCGKSDCVIGLALTRHRNSIIFRREYPQLRGMFQRVQALIGDNGRRSEGGRVWQLADGRTLEFGAVQHPGDEIRFQGRPHDFLALDEAPHFLREQFRFLIGWCRPADSVPTRCRVVLTGNPPTTPEGRWVVEEFAPWLDQHFTDPAEPGELRWYAMLDGVLVWVKPGVEFVHHPEGKPERAQTLRWDGPGHPLVYLNERDQREEITPRSRTFIPGTVDDNPVLLAAGYKATLQGMPEPLRSQMLYGDFNAGTQDDAWQVIPSAWISSTGAVTPVDLPYAVASG